MKQQKTLYLIDFAVSLVACKQEFLDITPLVGSTEANYYLTPEDAEAATIPLQQPPTRGHQHPGQRAIGRYPLVFRRYLLRFLQGGSVMGMSPTCFCLKTSGQRQAAFCSVNGKWRTAVLRTVTSR